MSESVDFTIPNDTLGQFVVATVSREDKEADNGAEPVRDQLEEEEEDDELQEVPPDLLKPYYCGFGVCRPKWLQLFANKKFFTLLLCLFAFLQGSVVSGYTSVVLSTIQTRYQFTSTGAGFIAVSYDVSVTISIVFISYFGGKTHRPRWLGISLLILGIGALVFASPQLLYGRYTAGSVSGQELEVCNDDRNITSECRISNDLAYVTYVLANVLIGIGAAPLYTVGQAYIDELVYPKYVPIYFGVFQTVSVIGPAFGYGVGSAFLSVYVDPWLETSLKTTDPAWVGAWWAPFVLTGFLCFFLSIPFLMYPKWLPDSHLVRKERAKEMAMIYPKKYANEDNLTIVIKMFPIHIKRLLTNLPFIFHTLAISFLFVLVSGFVSFAPKFFQNQFQLTATFAGLLSGGVGITAAGVGVITGGVILYLTKLRGRRLALFITVIIAIIIPITPSFLLNCPSLQVAGISVPYNDGSQSGEDSSPCAMNCSCTSTVFEPVCGSDGVTYFSPCRAGCSQTVDRNSFTSCSCVAEGLLQSIYSNISHDVIVANFSTASNGRCEHNCSALTPFVIIMLFTFFLVFITQIPILYFTVRVVADDQRALALGLNSAVYRVLGTIPGPLIFGALFDTSCLNWQDECGRRGNCWVHSNDSLSRSVLSFSVPVLTASVVCFLLALLTYPKKKKSAAEAGPSNQSSSRSNADSPLQKFLVKVPISPKRCSSNCRKESICSDEVLLDKENRAVKTDEDSSGSSQ